MQHQWLSVALVLSARSIFCSSLILSTAKSCFRIILPGIHTRLFGLYVADRWIVRCVLCALMIVLIVIV